MFRTVVRKDVGLLLANETSKGIKVVDSKSDKCGGAGSRHGGSIFCVANFKMNKNRYETNSYLDKLTALNNSKPETNIIICPPYTSLDKSIDNI